MVTWQHGLLLPAIALRKSQPDLEIVALLKNSSEVPILWCGFDFKKSLSKRHALANFPNSLRAGVCDTSFVGTASAKEMDSWKKSRFARIVSGFNFLNFLQSFKIVSENLLSYFLLKSALRIWYIFSLISSQEADNYFSRICSITEKKSIHFNYLVRTGA